MQLKCGPGMVLTATLLLAASLARAETDPVPQADGAAPGAALYAERCAQCHDHPVDRIPPRAFLTIVKTPDQVVTALSTGVMKPQAAGLDKDQIRSLARFITGKEPGAGNDPDPNANRCAKPAEPVTIGPDDWPMWGRDPGNTRYQERPGVAASDVPRLRPKWVFAYPGNLADGQPAVAGGMVFVANRAGRVFALDAATGCTHWSFEAEGGVHAAPVVARLGKAGSAAVFVTTENGWLHAFAPETGKPLWTTRVEDHPSTRLTGSPVAHDGRLYVPLASLEEVSLFNPSYACCVFRGGLAAVDAVSGKILWKVRTIAEEPRQIGTGPGGAKLFGPAGAAVFSAPTIDPRRRLVYVGTGNSYTQQSTGAANAVIAFDLDTGARRWERQVMEHDNICPKSQSAADCDKVGPDFDFAAPPVLTEAAGGREILVGITKADSMFGFDPDDQGKVLWTLSLGKGSRTAGVWGLATDRRSVYAGSADVRPSPGVEVGGFHAIDAASGKVLWRTPAPPAVCAWGDAPNALAVANGAVSCSPAQPAAAALIPGVVFSGSEDGHMRAYATAGGATVWDFDTARSFKAVNGVTATGGSLSNGTEAIAHGVLYVNSGSAGVHQPGNALIAFTVDGK